MSATSTWSCRAARSSSRPAGFPRAAIGKANLQLTGIGLALGGNARAGLEDTLYLRKGEIAQGNTPLVKRTADLARSLDLSIASVAETEKILSLPPRTAR